MEHLIAATLRDITEDLEILVTTCRDIQVSGSVDELRQVHWDLMCLARAASSVACAALDTARAISVTAGDLYFR